MADLLTAPLVVLVHGLYLRPLLLRPLARRLRARGLRTRLFGYRSWAADLDHAVSALQRELDTLTDPVIHLVGHSLGGLLLLELQRAGYRPRGRVVLLGSPLGGSRVAERLAQRRGGRWLLGRNRERMRQGFDGDAGNVEIGVIAGRTAIGVGRLLAGHGGTGDGTVELDETWLPGLSDRIVMAQSHTSLLFSAAVAIEITTFLAHGRFSAAAERPSYATA